MITLKKKHFGGRGCFYGSGWIANGDWMIRQDEATNGILFGCEPGVVAAAFGMEPTTELFGPKPFRNKDVPSEIVAKAAQATALRVSSVLIGGDVFFRSGKGMCARLAFSSSGEMIAYDDGYCKLLGIEAGSEIFGKPNGPAFSDSDPGKVRWVLMPMRLEKETVAEQLGAEFIQSVSKRSGRK